MIPNIRYYARLTDTTQKGKKTPKYTIVEEAGYYEPMQHLIGRDGLVSFNLMGKRKDGDSSIPSMSLQAKNSLNLTGLKDYFVDGKLSGYAYGYPSDKATYSKDNKPNPFYDYRKDGFLFITHYDEATLAKDPASEVEISALRPTEIEFVVLERGYTLISAYCKQLVMGGFDEALNEIREIAKSAKPIL